MTVKELIKVLKGVDGERIVILSSDAEGNSFSPMYNEGYCMSFKDGEVGLEKLTPGDIKSGFTEEDILKGEPAFVLYPQ